MSTADYWAARAIEHAITDDFGDAHLAALLAIRAELHTANLLAAAASIALPITNQGFGTGGYTLPPEAKALRAAIRDELDVDGITDGEATS